MKYWWQQLAARERLWLIIGATFLIIMMGYSFVWHPLLISNMKSQNAIQEKKVLLNWMQNAMTKLAAAPHSDETVSNNDQDSFSAVDNSLEKAEMKSYIKTLQQQGDAIQVNLKAVPFDVVINWLITLWQTDRIKVNTLSLMPQSTQGLVDVDLQLKKS